MAIQAGEDTFYQANRGVVQDGLVLNLDAGVRDSYDGGTTWRDLAGSNDGAMQNMNDTNLIKDNGGVFTFDGSNEYIDCGNPSLDISDGYTLMSWFKISTVSDANIINMDSSNNPLSRFFQFRINSSSKVQFIRFDSAINHIGTLSSSSSLVSGVWYNILASFDSSEGEKIYINSALDATSSIQTQNKSGSGTKLSIGCRYSNATASNFFHGDISTVQIYNRALTDAEVLQNFNATRHRFGV